MGASALTGHAANAWQDVAAMAGFESKAFKFEGAAQAVMKLHRIECWNAKSLIRDKLKRQLELAEKTPLRWIKVQDGLAFMKAKFDQSFWSRTLQKVGIVRITKEQFVEVCWDMMRFLPDYRGNHNKFTPQDRDDLLEIFDCIDFDKGGSLGRGEIAGACSVFFHGTTEEYIKAVFEVLDADSTGTVDEAELQEYLRPFVHAMIPDEARALEPMLLKRCNDVVFEDMDADQSHGITEAEMLRWTKSGKNIIDSLSELIDREVYAAWMENNAYAFRTGAAPPAGSKEAQELLLRQQQLQAPQPPPEAAGQPAAAPPGASEAGGIAGWLSSLGSPGGAAPAGDAQGAPAEAALPPAPPPVVRAVVPEARVAATAYAPQPQPAPMVVSASGPCRSVGSPFTAASAVPMSSRGAPGYAGSPSAASPAWRPAATSPGLVQSPLRSPLAAGGCAASPVAAPTAAYLQPQLRYGQVSGAAVPGLPQAAGSPVMGLTPPSGLAHIVPGLGQPGFAAPTQLYGGSPGGAATYVFPQGGMPPRAASTPQ